MAPEKNPMTFRVAFDRDIEIQAETSHAGKAALAKIPPRRSPPDLHEHGNLLFNKKKAAERRRRDQGSALRPTCRTAILSRAREPPAEHRRKPRPIPELPRARSGRGGERGRQGS